MRGGSESSDQSCSSSEMEKFRTVLNVAHQQSNLCFGVVALLTAGGEQLFSSVVFQCPCRPGLNFTYGLVCLLVPALALLLLGYILNKRTWKLLTGLCRQECRCKRLAMVGGVLVQVSISALVAPASWIAVALLSGNYYECAMSGVNVTVYTKHLCGERGASRCQRELFLYPCEGPSGGASPSDRDQVLRVLRAESQILGWLLIASVMLFNVMLTCLARCTSPISYLHLKFWRVYAEQETSLMDTYATKNAKELAERNLKSFFNKTPPEDIQTPSNKEWERISSLYKFTDKDQFYSMLHRYVDGKPEMEVDAERIQMNPISPADTPTMIHPALNFVDGAGVGHL